MLSFVFCVQNPNNGVVGFGERGRERERESLYSILCDDDLVSRF
jgi:hypothetical protein